MAQKLKKFLFLFFVKIYLIRHLQKGMTSTSFNENKSKRIRIKSNKKKPWTLLISSQWLFVLMTCTQICKLNKQCKILFPVGAHIRVASTVFCFAVVIFLNSESNKNWPKERLCLQQEWNLYPIFPSRKPVP